MKPYYQDDYCTIYHGDCRVLLGEMPTANLVLTDPPYGMKWDGNVGEGTNGHGRAGARARAGADGIRIVGDEAPFDPSPWMAFEKVIMFGANHYAQRLPAGTTLVWIKKYDKAFGSYLSDAEVAWMKGGHGVYCFRDTSMNAEANSRKHPAQKPITLMQWCIEKSGSADGLILDPFMGSGTTLRAAKDLQRKAVGIEIEEKYCEIAAKRLAQEVLAL